MFCASSNALTNAGFFFSLVPPNTKTFLTYLTLASRAIKSIACFCFRGAQSQTFISGTSSTVYAERFEFTDKSAAQEFKFCRENWLAGRAMTDLSKALFLPMSVNQSFRVMHRSKCTVSCQGTHMLINFRS